MSVPTTGAQRRDEGQARVIDNSPAAYRDRLDEIQDPAMAAIAAATQSVSDIVVRDALSATAQSIRGLIGGYRDVLDMHEPVDIEPSSTICRACSWQLPNGHFFGKVEEYPCPTIEAITTALGATS